MNNLCEFLGEEPPSNTKMCSKCREVKNITDFGCRAHRKNGTIETHNFCKKCGAIQSKFLSRARRTIPKPTVDYICPCCKKTEKEILNFFGSLQGKAKGTKRTLWTLDHDHHNLEIREYVCLYCNDTLSRSGDSPETLRGCANYLEKHKKAA